jgi:signal peptide peptidase SppA
MDVLKRYANVLTFFQSYWMLPRSMMEKGVAIMSLLGTPEYDMNRDQFYNDREEDDEINNLLIVSAMLNASVFDRRSSDPKSALLGKMRVSLTQGGTAIVPVEGVLGKNMNSIDISTRGVSADMLADTFDILGSDERVRAVVANMHSPGGSVEGIELAKQAFAHLSDTKPTISLANAQMASGAYYIASQANRIDVTPTSMVGSIGVITSRLDATEFEANRGLKFHIISAGDFKADGHPSTPFSAAEGKRIESDITHIYNMFIDAVATGRDIPRKDALALGDGSIEIGINAVDRGLADKMSSLKQTVMDADRQGAKLFAANTNNTEDTSMSRTKSWFSGSSTEADAPEQPEAAVDTPDVNDDGSAAELQAELNRLREMEAELAQRERQVITREASAFIETLKASGKLLPARAPLARAILTGVAVSEITVQVEQTAVNAGGSITSETKSMPLAEAFKQFLESANAAVVYGEIATQDQAITPADVGTAQGAEDELATIMAEEKVTASEALAILRKRSS